MMSGDTSFNMSTGMMMSESAQKMLDDFWPDVTDEIKKQPDQQYKTQELPLARIKKIMKLDEDVKMISAEAPVLFAKAADLFVRELSLRAWINTEDNKRRTLQRNDIATAISKYDQFDFLIDIVPREELKPAKRQDDLTRGGTSLPEQIQYYLQLAQQQSQQQSQQTATTQPAVQQQQSQPAPQTQSSQVVAQPQAAQATTNTQAVLQQIQQAVTQQSQTGSGQTNQTTTVQLPGGQVMQPQFQIQQNLQPQVIQLPQQLGQQVVGTQATVMQQLQQQQLQTQVQQQQQQQQPQQQQQQQQSLQGAQIFQQVINQQSGQVENVPIQLTPQQLQQLQLHVQGKVGGQQIVLQAPQAADQTVQFTQAQPLYQIQQTQAGQQPIFLQASDEQAEGTGES